MTVPPASTLCVLPLLLGILPAQAPPERPLRDAKAIVADLASIEPEVVAWAAHDARRLGDKSLIAPLQKVLRARRDDQDPLVAFARLFVLDALAGLDGKVPAVELLPWLGDERAGPVAFLLLARQPKMNEAELFTAFRAEWPLPATADRLQTAIAQHPALRVQAIGNLLCAQKTPGFAAFLLDHIDLDLHAKVTTPGRASGRSSSARVFFGEAMDLTEGLPPLPVYTYLRTDRPGSNACELIAPGPIDIGIARRQLAQEPPRARSGSLVGSQGLAEPLPWLRALAGDRPVPRTALTIPFRSAVAYTRELTEARDALREFRRRLLADLVVARALGEDDAARLGKVDVQVHVTDERTDTSEPLPELPPAK